ncbi:hypothetical protein NKG05_21655 [Oerskovia sp. M15]
MTDGGNGDFEFERRFLVKDVPANLLDAPALIVQGYFLAQDGYAIRLRVQASSTSAPLTASSSPLSVLGAHTFDFCALTVKGPTNGGTRYEAEREIDVNVGVEMIRRGGGRIVKTRYSAWLGADGWVIDVFGGANYPLSSRSASAPPRSWTCRSPRSASPRSRTTGASPTTPLAHPVLGVGGLVRRGARGLRPRFRQDFGHNARLLGE